MIEIKVSRDALKKGLYWTQNVVERKTTKPILSNALFDCSSDSLKISATDLEVGVCVEVPAKVNNPGKIAVPAKSLYEITKEIAADEITFRHRDEQWVEISAGSSKFKMVGLSPQEFPSMPDLPKSSPVELGASLLKSMIQKTIFAVSTDETKYNLSGIFFESAGEKKMRMVATDGHRLSLTECDLAQPLKLAKGVLLPRKGIQELQKLLQEEDESIPFYFEGRNVIVKKGEVTLFIRLIEGEFPDYRQAIPKKNDKNIHLSREQLVRALRRVSLLSQDHNRGVKMTFSSGHVDLLCSNPDLGEAREELECDYKGEHLEVGFNYRYFLDVLAVLGDETLRLELKDQVSPCIIKSESDPNFLSLIMPMRL